MASLRSFSVDDLVTFSSDLRVAGEHATTMVDAGCVVTRYLYENLLDDDGDPACALVRIYKTHRFDQLPPARQELAQHVDPGVERATLCMTVIASNGRPDLPPESLPEEWVLPFTHRSFDDVPVMSKILGEVGLDLETAVEARRALELRQRRHRFNVFLDQDLPNSPLLPNPAHRARMRAVGMRSLAVVGGILPSGELLLVMWYGRDDIPPRVADLFRSLALAVEAALVPFTYSVFEPRRPA